MSGTEDPRSNSEDNFSASPNSPFDVDGSDLFRATRSASLQATDISPEDSQPGRGKKGGAPRVKACNPCRRRKTKCNPNGPNEPCSVCLEKGEGATCVYEDTAAATKRRKKDTSSLRIQLDRLDSLLDNLGSRSDRQGSDERFWERWDEDTAQDESGQVETDNIVTALSDLAISPLNGPMVRASMAPPLVEEARNFHLLREEYKSQFKDVAYDAASIFRCASKPPVLEDIIPLLPTEEQAKVAFRVFMIQPRFFIYPLVSQTITQEWDNFWETPVRDVHPHWLAVFFAMCLVGLHSMTPGDISKAGVFPEKEPLMRKWLDASMQCLLLGDFMNSPTLDAIRAIILQNHHHLYMSSGDLGGSALVLTSTALSLAREMGLLHETAEIRGRLNHLELEDRRRVCWGLLKQLFMFTTLMGRPQLFSRPDLSRLPLPSDAHDSDITAESIKIRGPHEPPTPITSIRASAEATCVIDRARRSFANDEKKLTRKEVMDIDAFLQNLEKNHSAMVPFDGRELKLGDLIDEESTPTERAMTGQAIGAGLVIAYANLVLHRPFILATKVPTDHRPPIHRERVLHYSQFILACWRQGAMAEHWHLGRHILTSAVIALCCDLLENPDSPEASSIRSDVKKFMNDYASSASSSSSSIVRRGLAIMSFLMEKEALAQEALRQHPRKKSRSADGLIQTARGSEYPEEDADELNHIKSENHRDAPARHSPRKDLVRELLHFDKLVDSDDESQTSTSASYRLYRPRVKSPSSRQLQPLPVRPSNLEPNFWLDFNSTLPANLTLESLLNDPVL